MKHVVIFEDDTYRNLLPLVYWRTVCELRTGYASLLDHARAALGDVPITLYVRGEIEEVVRQRLALPVNVVPDDDHVLFISARALLMHAPTPLDPPAVQWRDGRPLFIAADRALVERLGPDVFLDEVATRKALEGAAEGPPVNDGVRVIKYPWNLVHANPAALARGWKLWGGGNANASAYPGVHFLGTENIHIGPGTRIKPGAVLDAEEGPIYIGRDVRIGPTATLEGPCYVGDRCVVQAGVVIRSDSSIGPVCKVGGEVEGSILHAYSNKQHDGFLGHAYVGEWVNLGADTVNSDLKNTYGSVRVLINNHEIDSGEMFVGLTIGDHSKAGIGQLFPTGAVVGFGSSVATGGLARKFIPSFAWITASGGGPYDVKRCLAVARKVMARRNVEMTSAEEALFLRLPKIAARHEREGPTE